MIYKDLGWEEEVVGAGPRKRRLKARIRVVQRRLEEIQNLDLSRLEFQLRREYLKIHGLFLEDGSWCMDPALMSDEGLGGIFSPERERARLSENPTTAL
ncbi:hypothetical protein Lal_00002333 [Lupinus albus]|nr:hypothetical protein Lal_00002333 [Lupinus albus]